MTEHVSAYTGADQKTVVSVSAAHAKNAGLTLVPSDPPLERGRVRGPRPAPKKPAKKTSAKKAAESPTGGPAASKPEEATK